MSHLTEQKGSSADTVITFKKKKSILVFSNPGSESQQCHRNGSFSHSWHKNNNSNIHFHNTSSENCISLEIQDATAHHFVLS